MSTALLYLIEKILPAKIKPLVINKLRATLSIFADTSQHRRSERTALVAFAIRVVSAAMAFVIQIILARAMGEFEYGIYIFVWVFVVMAGNLSCLGFHSSVIKLIGQYQEANDLNHIRGLTSGSRIFAMVIATCVAFVGISFIYFFADLVPSYYLVPVMLGATALPMIALGDMLDGTSRAHSWPFIALSPTYIMRPCLIVVLFLAAFQLGFNTNAETALICAIIAAYLTSLTQFLIVTQKLRRQYKEGNRTWDMSHWVKAALPVFMIESLNFLMTNADVLIVGFVLPPDQVAIYFAAAKTMALVHFVYFAVKASAGPNFAEIAAKGDKKELEAAAQKSAKWCFWPTLFVGGSVLALGPFLLSLFGSTFSQGYPVMAILFIGIILKALIGPGEVLLVMVNKQRICALIYAIAFSFNVVLNIILIPEYGINGAAFATALAMVLEAILLLAIIKRRVKIFMFALLPQAPRDTAEIEQSNTNDRARESREQDVLNNTKGLS